MSAAGALVSQPGHGARYTCLYVAEQYEQLEKGMKFYGEKWRERERGRKGRESYVEL